MDSAKNFEELKVEVEDLLTGLGKFLAELADGGASAGPVANAALDARLGESHRTYCQLRARHREQNLTVAVLALTKSGLSPPLQGCALSGVQLDYCLTVEGVIGALAEDLAFLVPVRGWAANCPYCVGQLRCALGSCCQVRRTETRELCELQQLLWPRIAFGGPDLGR